MAYYRRAADWLRCSVLEVMDRVGRGEFIIDLAAMFADAEARVPAIAENWNS